MLFNKKGARILVVDDDKDLADNLVEYLSKLGYQASPAYGGREGLTMFEQGDFQLVITDLKMPEMDGMELLNAVSRLDSRVMVTVITGYGTIESAVEAIKKGAYDFIPKPFKMEELEIIVKRALERHTLLRQLGIFRGLTLALIISVPFWLILGIILSLVWK
jgi:two-component system phosphate regulon sensor histidine kinase PhoR